MLKLDHISKSFDGVSVLNDISLEVQDGEIVSILGPSGCGKTTLLNLILGITDTDEGTIYYQEEDITKLSMEKRDFNIVFQDYALFPNLNVYQNIVYGLRNKPGLSTAEEVDALIDLLDEPLSALDGVIKESIKDKIKTISRQFHLTTIIVTHDPEEALTLSDRVLIIEHGKISQYDTPAQIVHSPQNDFVRKFILNQLVIKRDNILTLFGAAPLTAGKAV